MRPPRCLPADSSHRLSDDWANLHEICCVYHNTRASISGILHTFLPSKVKVKVVLRPSVSRPVCLGVRQPTGTRDQFFFRLEIFFRQLRVGFFVVFRLTSGSVFYCCCWSSPEQWRSGLSPAGLKTIFCCPNSWGYPNLQVQVPVFISPRNRVAQPGADWVPFPSPLTTHKATVEVFYPASTRESLPSKSKLYYNRQSVGQSVLVTGDHLRPVNNFSFLLFEYF
jgi:hypothetical protein